MATSIRRFLSKVVNKVRSVWLTVRQAIVYSWGGGGCLPVHSDVQVGVTCEVVSCQYVSNVLIPSINSYIRLVVLLRRDVVWYVLTNPIDGVRELPTSEASRYNIGYYQYSINNCCLHSYRIIMSQVNIYLSQYKNGTFKVMAGRIHSYFDITRCEDHKGCRPFMRAIRRGVCRARFPHIVVFPGLSIPSPNTVQ